MLSKRWQDKHRDGIFSQIWIKNGMRSPSEATIDMVTYFKLVISALENPIIIIGVNINISKGVYCTNLTSLFEPQSWLFPEHNDPCTPACTDPH